MAFAGPGPSQLGGGGAPPFAAPLLSGAFAAPLEEARSAAFAAPLEEVCSVAFALAGTSREGAVA